MANYVVPTLGSIGFFELRAPFDTKILLNERYSCQAVRKISDYIANNEDVQALVYTANTLTEQDYTDAANEDMYIVSLQSDKGHWVYVPVNYILKFPITNGIPYRNITLSVALPAIPANKNLSNLETDIANLVKDSLGVDSVIRQVQTSRVTLVPKNKHDSAETARALISNGRVTDRSRYMKAMQDLQTALNKIQDLEEYIKNRL